MHKTSYDLTKWIGDLKNNDLSVFLFNKTLVFDDLSYALTEKYQVERVLTKDISIGAGSHHSQSSLWGFMLGLDPTEATSLFTKESHDCHGMTEMACALNQTYFDIMMKDASCCDEDYVPSVQESENEDETHDDDAHRRRLGGDEVVEDEEEGVGILGPLLQIFDINGDRVPDDSRKHPRKNTRKSHVVGHAGLLPPSFVTNAYVH